MDRYESILSKCTLQACWPSGSWSLASHHIVDRYDFIFWNLLVWQMRHRLEGQDWPLGSVENTSGLGFKKKHKHTRLPRLRCGSFRQTVLFVSWVFYPKNRTRCWWRAFGDWRILLSKLELEESKTVNFHGSELPDLFGRFPSACPLPHLQGQQYVRRRFHHTELFKIQTVAWQNCNKLLVHLLVDSLTSRIGKQLFWWVMKSWRLTGRIATLQSQVISEYLRFTRDSMFLKFWSNLKAPSKQKPRCFRSQSSLIQII